MYDLYSKFDPIEHAKKYPFYTEVIIKEDGSIEYAIPSHQEKLIEILQNQRNWSREEVNNACPPEYYCDFIQWLLNETKCASVWYEFCIAPEQGISQKQQNSLKMLKTYNCYQGEIP